MRREASDDVRPFVRAQRKPCALGEIWEWEHGFRIVVISLASARSDLLPCSNTQVQMRMTAVVVSIRATCNSATARLSVVVMAGNRQVVGDR